MTSSELTCIHKHMCIHIIGLSNAIIFAFHMKIVWNSSPKHTVIIWRVCSTEVFVEWKNKISKQTNNVLRDGKSTNCFVYEFLCKNCSNNICVNSLWKSIDWYELDLCTNIPINHMIPTTFYAHSTINLDFFVLFL